MCRRAAVLTTAQKALSVLLSIILAVGLSPFGQAPNKAWAANGGEITTQADSVTPNKDLSENKTLTGSLSSREFNGEDLAGTLAKTLAVTDSSQKTADVGEDAAVKVFFFADATKARTGNAADVLAACTRAGGALAGQEGTLIDADTYAARVELGGDYATTYLVATATITVTDITNADGVGALKLADINADSTYNGKTTFTGYPIPLKLDAEAEQKITTASGVELNLLDEDVAGSLSMSRPSVKDPEIATFQLKGSKNLTGNVTLSVYVQPATFSADAFDTGTLVIPNLTEVDTAYKLKDAKFGAVTDPLKGAKYGANGEGKGYTDLSVADGTIAVAYEGTVTKRDGKTLKTPEAYDGADFPTEIGSYTATITGATNVTGVTIASTGNYSGTKAADFTIQPVSILSDGVAFDWGEDDLSYTGGPVEPSGHLALTNADKTTYELVKGVDYTIGAKASTALSYKSANAKVATVDADGNVTGVAAGKTTVTITAAGTDSYKSATKTVTLKIKVTKK